MALGEKMKKYNDDIKTEAIREFQSGIKCSEIFEKYGIPKTTLYYWVRKNQAIMHCKKNKQLNYADYNKMEQRLRNTEQEIEILLNLHCFPDATTKAKQEAISKFVGKYPVKTMCRILNIPTGTFYNYYFRRKTVTSYQVRDEKLKQEILRVYLDSGKRFGTKKITIKLRNEGYQISMNKVKTLMKSLNIQSIQKLYKKEECKPVNRTYYTNKLKRQFVQDSPNKFWVSDVTEVKVGLNKFYLCVILDLFSRKAIAYRLSSQNNISLTLNTFKDAFEYREAPKELSFHSDQGCNYTAYEFRDLLRSLKVTQSFSKSGNPYDNACMESFFSNFKRDEYNTVHYKFFDNLKASVESYIQYYNDYRPHNTLNNLTPNQFETEYYRKKDNIIVTSNS